MDIGFHILKNNKTSFNITTTYHIILSSRKVVVDFTNTSIYELANFL